MLGIITLSTLKKKYQDYLQSQNSDINPYAPNDFWEMDAGASASQMLDLYMNLQLVKNSIFPQYSSGDDVDQWLYTQGLPPRGGLTFGTILVNIISAGNGQVNDGDIFTDLASVNPAPAIATNNQYKSLISTTISTNNTLTLYATSPGPNIVEPVGNKLTSQDGTKVFSVIYSTGGQLLESDQSGINRILNGIRIPAAGARSSDYENYAYEASSDVTYALAIPGFFSVNNILLLGLFIFVGTELTEWELNQGLLPATTFIQYSRQAPSSTIEVVNNDIQSLKLVGLSVSVGTAVTVVPPGLPLNIIVALPDGYSLSTMITIVSQDQNLNPIIIQLSVDSLIRREARRAICSIIGGTKIGSSLYITMNSIEKVLNDNLSSENGKVAKLLNNIKINSPDILAGTRLGNNIGYINDILNYNSSFVITQQVSM